MSQLHKYAEGKLCFTQKSVMNILTWMQQHYTKIQHQKKKQTHCKCSFMNP